MFDFSRRTRKTLSNRQKYCGSSSSSSSSLRSPSKPSVMDDLLNWATLKCGRLPFEDDEGAFSEGSTANCDGSDLQKKNQTNTTSTNDTMNQECVDECPELITNVGKCMQNFDKSLTEDEFLSNGTDNLNKKRNYDVTNYPTGNTVEVCVDTSEQRDMVMGELCNAKQSYATSAVSLMTNLMNLGNELQNLDELPKSTDKFEENSKMLAAVEAKLIQSNAQYLAICLIEQRIQSISSSDAIDFKIKTSELKEKLLLLQRHTNDVNAKLNAAEKQTKDEKLQRFYNIEAERSLDWIAAQFEKISKIEESKAVALQAVRNLHGKIDAYKKQINHLHMISNQMANITKSNQITVLSIDFIKNRWLDSWNYIENMLLKHQAWAHDKKRNVKCDNTTSSMKGSKDTMGDTMAIPMSSAMENTIGSAMDSSDSTTRKTSASTVDEGSGLELPAKKQANRKTTRKRQLSKLRKEKTEKNEPSKKMKLTLSYFDNGSKSHSKSPTNCSGGDAQTTITPPLVNGRPVTAERRSTSAPLHAGQLNVSDGDDDLDDADGANDTVDRTDNIHGHGPVRIYGFDEIAGTALVLMNRGVDGVALAGWSIRMTNGEESVNYTFENGITIVGMVGIDPGEIIVWSANAHDRSHNPPREIEMNAKNWLIPQITGDVLTATLRDSNGVIVDEKQLVANLTLHRELRFDDRNDTIDENVGEHGQNAGENHGQNDGGPNNGGQNNGGPNNGGQNNGGPNNGGQNNGGPNNGGPNNGGQNNGGPNDGGPNNGGQNDGGPNNGGQNNGPEIGHEPNIEPGDNDNANNRLVDTLSRCGNYLMILAEKAKEKQEMRHAQFWHSVKKSKTKSDVVYPQWAVRQILALPAGPKRTKMLESMSVAMMRYHMENLPEKPGLPKPGENAQRAALLQWLDN